MTPPGIGEAQINAIEISPHDRATAYVVAAGYKRNDRAPHMFKTNDYGKSWKAINSGFRPDDFARVVREDPGRLGLLYAGSETGVYLSWDDGAHWQSLRLNLPAVPVTDLRVHNHDLIVSTEGRGFWILDDITPIEQINADVGKAEACLFTPRTAVRIAPPTQYGPENTRNPQLGAFIDYCVSGEESNLMLEILDSSGNLVRKVTSEPPMPGEGAPASRLPARKGMNRFAWDLRNESLTRIPGILPRGNTLGYVVGPDTYQVRLTVISGAERRTLQQPLTVVADPRTTLTKADFAQQQQLLASVTARINQISQAVARVRAARDRIASSIERTAGAGSAKDIAERAKILVEGITKWEEKLVQPRRQADLDFLNFRSGLLDQYIFLRDMIDWNYPPLPDAMNMRAAELDAAWAPLEATLKSLEQEIAAVSTQK
ncbi:MAG: hypothetical protein ABSH28_19510 [Acidobacteriota bacterium]